MRALFIIITLLVTSVLAQDVSIQPVPSVTEPVVDPSVGPTPDPTPIITTPDPVDSSTEPPTVTTPIDTPSDTPSITSISDTTTPSGNTDPSTGPSAVPTGTISGSDSVSASGSSAASINPITSASGVSGGNETASAPSSGAPTVTMSTINMETMSLPSGSSPSSSIVASSAPPSSGSPGSSTSESSASGSSASSSIDATASGSASSTNSATGVVVGPGAAGVPETRIPLINVEPTDTIAGFTSTINSASTSIPTTPVIAATARSYPLDQGEDNFVVARDEINLPERFISDEIVTTLTYTANYDKNLCEAKAQQYSTRASQSLLSHWSFLMHRRQNTPSSSLCLPALYEIPTTVHWVIPSNANRDQWVNWDAWNYQITQTRNQLQQLNVALNLAPFRFYQGADSDRMTNRPKAPENLDFAKGWVSAAKQASDSTAYNHLNIFIVENPNDDSLGYSNYPGASADSYYPDAVILGAASLPGNTKLNDQANVGDQDGREGTTLAHEIGHWLGLLHLHEDGCDGTDGITTTPQYASGSDYSKTCLGEDKGPDGIYEHNMMSFAAGRTVKSAFFNQEQLVRAAVGYFLRRNGLSSSNIESQWLKLCPEQARNVTRRSLPLYDSSSHAPLTRRQMSNELSRYCQQTDLTVPDYEYSSLASAGLFNPNSPGIPSSPGIVIPQGVTIGNVETGSGDRAGSNFGDVNQRVNAQIAQTGSISSSDITPIDSPEPPARNNSRRATEQGTSRYITMVLALLAFSMLV